MRRNPPPHWFVMGDINLDMNFANSVCDVSVVFKFTNLVNGPTCFKGDTPSSVDVLLSSELQRFKSALNAQCFPQLNMCCHETP